MHAAPSQGQNSVPGTHISPVPSVSLVEDVVVIGSPVRSVTSPVVDGSGAPVVGVPVVAGVSVGSVAPALVVSDVFGGRVVGLAKLVTASPEEHAESSNTTDNSRGTEQAMFATTH